MNQKLNEKGQALIVIAIAGIVLFGFAALAIDGSMALSDRRHAQNAADTAALAGALAYSRGNNIDTAARSRATANSYDDGPMSDVTVTTRAIVAGSNGCPGKVAGMEITVTIVSFIDTTFARVVGWNRLTNTVTATSRGCGFYMAALFGGNAIVGLNPTSSECAFDSGNSNAAHWTLVGGGIFSNGCAFSKNPNSVTMDPDACLTSVGSSSGFSCSQPGDAIDYPADVLAIMPPNPCDGTPGDVGLPQGSGSTFSNGIYCISNMDALDQKDIVLSNATLYVTDTVFNLKFAGRGGFYGSPTQGGDYSDYYMIIAYDPTPCQRFTDNNAQVIEWRGNGSGSFSGTVLAPSACIDLRGNADQSAMHSQIIGYIVGSNGTAEVYVNYQEEENHQTPVHPSITLLK